MIKIFMENPILIFYIIGLLIAIRTLIEYIKVMIADKRDFNDETLSNEEFERRCQERSERIDKGTFLFD